MVYPVVGTIIDHVGFLPTFKATAWLGFGATLIVLITRNKLYGITRHHFDHR
jgi:hypothetical protein